MVASRKRTLERYNWGGLIKVCQRIVWIGFLNNFGRFTPRQGLAILNGYR
jgi:hypothetical protein